MTKVLRSLLALTVVATAIGTQAARADGGPFNAAFTVTLVIAPAQPACPGTLAVEAHGIGQTQQGPMFLTIKKCFDPASHLYAGTFALCPSDSACRPDSDDAVSGTYAGAQDLPANIADFTGVIFTPFHGTMTIDRDNGHYGWARGTINFTAISARLAPTGFPTMGTAYYALRAADRGND